MLDNPAHYTPDTQHQREEISFFLRPSPPAQQHGLGAVLLGLVLLDPGDDGVAQHGLGLLDGRGREVGRGLVGEDAVLVPVVDGLVDEDVGLAEGALAVGLAERVRRRRPPGVPLPVHDRQPRVADPEPAVLVDRLHVRLARQPERVPADRRRVLQVHEPRYHAQLALGHAAARL